MSDNDSLIKIRNRIDAIDTQMLELLNERAQCAETVAEIKKASLAPNEDVLFYRPEREAKILRRMMEENTGPLESEHITLIYRSIISSCLALEERLKVAYLGPAGTFTQGAVTKQFGQWVDTVPQETIADVFKEVDLGRANYGVVPIENSTGGMVTHTLDMFMTTSLSICGEVRLRIHQNLLASSGDWHQAERVYSHEQSLSQCQQWLTKHLPDAELKAVNSNAEAARLVKKDDKAVAIAGELAGIIYGLHAVERNIEDHANNTTRFLIIANQKVLPSGNDKTTLMLSARNKPGSLYSLLKPLAEHGLDMSRIESRPSKNVNWEYVFFVDIKGHEDEEHVRNALDELSTEADYLRVLGSYPRAID